MICSSVNFDRFIVRSFKVGRTLASDGGVIWGHSTAHLQQIDWTSHRARHLAIGAMAVAAGIMGDAAQEAVSVGLDMAAETA